jgi:putative ABC transport system permease protein
MFKNNIKTAIRDLLRNKGFAFLNVAGLVLGISIGLLIVFYVTDELSFDKYNKKADRIFRINTDVKFGNSTVSFAQAGPPMAAALTREFPEVEKSIRITASSNRFKKGNEQVLEDRGAYCDPGIFGFFTLPMIEGDPVTALKEPNSIVVTESMAKKYFNRGDVLGQNRSPSLIPLLVTLNVPIFNLFLGANCGFIF